jgi:hypothetical protein
MIHFTCPACHRSIRAPDHMGGQRHKCPGCQHVLAVPEVSSSAESAVANLPAVRPGTNPVSAEQRESLPARTSSDATASRIVLEVASDSAEQHPSGKSVLDPTVDVVEAPHVAATAAPAVSPASALPPPAEAAPRAAVIGLHELHGSELRPPRGLRAWYFAPAAYVATDPQSVLFKAPGLRRRLEQFSEHELTPAGRAREPGP